MKRKAVPNINNIPNKHNPLFEKYTNVFDIAFNKNINKSSDLDLLDALYINDRITDNEQSFDKRFEYIIRLNSHDVEEHFYTFLSEKYQSIDKAGNIYFLVGKIGTGKTSFIKHFIYNHKYINAFYIDLEPFAVPIEPSFEEIKEEIINKIKNHLNGTHPEYFVDLLLLREIYANTYPKEISVDSLIKNANSNIEEYIARIYKHLFNSRKESKLILVFDNGDTCSKNIIKTIFGIIKRLVERIPALFIFSVREYIPNCQILGPDFQNTYPMISLPPIKISVLIKRRLEWAIKKIKENEGYGFNEIFNKDIEIIQTYSNIPTEKTIKINPLTAQSILLESSKIFDGNGNSDSIYNNLLKLSDGNIREIIELIYSFFHSPNLDLIPFIKNIYNDKPIIDARDFDFRDFIGCIISKHKDCYDTESSPIINIFNLDNSNFDNDPHNTLGLTYILMIIRHSEIIEKPKLINKLILMKFSEERISRALNNLLDWNMISSPMHEYPEIQFITEFRLTEKGHFYLDYMIHQFKYIMYMSESTPMSPNYIVSLEKRQATSKNIINAVTYFLDFLKSEVKLFDLNLKERQDLIRTTIYSEGVSIVDEISHNIDNEINRIKREFNKTLPYQK